MTLSLTEGFSFSISLSSATPPGPALELIGVKDYAVKKVLDKATEAKGGNPKIMLQTQDGVRVVGLIPPNKL